MSSPASRRSQQAQSQATPRAARQNVPSSSPLFFRSSPVAAPNGVDNRNVSSPLKQASVAEDTPRPVTGGNDLYIHLLHEYIIEVYRFFTHTLCAIIKSSENSTGGSRSRYPQQQQRPVHPIISLISTRIFRTEQFEERRYPFRCLRRNARS